MNYIESEFVKRFGEQEGIILFKKLNNSKKNASRRQIEVDLNWDDINLLAKPLLGYGFCDYTGQPFGEDDMKPSIERIDSNLGYVRGNICIVTVMANRVKNYIYDSTEDKSTLQPEHKDVIRQMMQNCTGDHMEQLKKKYIPKTNDKLEETIVKKEVQVEKEVMLEDVAEAVEDKQIPEDIRMAEQYASWLRFMIKAGYEVTLTFFEYKNLVKAKRCFITGRELGQDMQPVIFDLNGKIEKTNVKFASEEAAKAMNNLIDKTGMTMQELVSSFKKTIK